ALEKRLPAVLRGKEKASADDLLQMAEMCGKLKRQYRWAARLYQDAFEAEPRFLQDPLHLHRAAVAVALAAAGRGEPATKLKDEEKATLRRQARVLLDTELRVYANGMAKDKLTAFLQAAENLPRWQRDPALAGVREARELDRLPQEEKQAW